MGIVDHRNLRRHVRTVVPINRPPIAGKLAFPLVTFLARDDEAEYVYQVKGEVEAMRYQPSSGPVSVLAECEKSFHTLLSHSRTHRIAGSNGQGSLRS